MWPAGWALAAEALPAAATVLVAGLGLAGLARRATPERRFLGWSLLAGMLLVGLGYAGVAGSPVAGTVRTLLDGPLAPLRNVHKFDPVLRLPLTLGLSVALGRVAPVVRGWVSRLRGPDGTWLRAHPRAAPAAAVVVAVLPLLLATGAAWTGRLAPPGSFTAIPTWWQQTADWLAEHDDGRALLEPASRFAEYTWGSPHDEPLQALARTPWAVRGSVSLGAPGATRLLDGVESLLSTGHGAADLAAALNRAGVRYIVLRNDLAPEASATPPAVARAAIVASPGMVRVAAFGPTMASTAASVPELTGVLAARPAVEVFAVGPAALAHAQLLGDSPLGLSGGPEALAGSVPVDTGTPYVAVADGGPRTALLATDTLRRRVANLGAAATEIYGPTVASSVDVRQGRPAADVLPYDGVSHQTTARLIGAVSISTSSSASDPFANDYLGPGYSGYAAVDGSARTAWVSDVRDASPSLRIDLRAPTTLADLSLDFSALPVGTFRPQRVTVETAAGSWSGAIGSDHVRVGLAAVVSSWLVVRLYGQPGITVHLALGEISGLPAIGRSIVGPSDADAAAGSSTWAFVREPDSRRACVNPGSAWVCSPWLSREAEESGPLDRTFLSAAPSAVRPDVLVTPRQGPALDRLLDASGGVTVDGSSQLVPDAADRPGAAVDGNPATAWMTTASDVAPQLALSYPEAVTVRGLAITAPASTRDRVRAVVVQANGRTQSTVRATLGPDGAATFAPVSGSRLTITFVLGGGVSGPQPSVFSEVRLTGAPPPREGVVALGCGRGPTVVLDGRTIPTSVTATRDQLLSGAPLPARTCSAAPVGLTAGTHRLVAAPGPDVEVSSVRLVPAAATSQPSAAVPPGRTSPLTVVSWGPERRVVELTVPTGGVLALDEGFNPGWQASVNGHELEPVRVDGWRQAWQVPAGTSGAVLIVFTPATLQRLGLGLGVLALLGLGLAAALPSRGPGPPPAPARDGSARALPTASFVAAGLLAGPVGILGGLAAQCLAARRAAAGALVGSAGLACMVGFGASDPARHGWWPQAAVQFLSVAVVVVAVSDRRSSFRPLRACRRTGSR